MEEENEPRLIKLANLAEKLVKLSAILGAFGYMSLRAHLNYLGISSTSSLGVERYLMETYNLVGTILIPLFLILLGGAIAFVLIYPIGFFVLKIQKVKLAVQTLQKYVSKQSKTSMLPVLLIALLLLFYIWLFRVLTNSGADTDVAVGRLVVDRLNHSDVDWFFYLVCIVCVVGYSIYSKYSEKKNNLKAVAASNLRKFLWTLFAFALTLLAVQLPILYGVLVRSTDYPLAQVQYDTTESQTICGVLVQDASSSLTLWKAENGVGHLIVIPQSRVRLMSTGGMIDLLKAARENAANPAAARPDCSDLQFSQKTTVK
jgi:hypothetical protein